MTAGEGQGKRDEGRASPAEAHLGPGLPRELALKRLQQHGHLRMSDGGSSVLFTAKDSASVSPDGAQQTVGFWVSGREWVRRCCQVERSCEEPPPASVRGATCGRGGGVGEEWDAVGFSKASPISSGSCRAAQLRKGRAVVSPQRLVAPLLARAVQLEGHSA